MGFDSSLTALYTAAQPAIWITFIFAIMCLLFSIFQYIHHKQITVDYPKEDLHTGCKGKTLIIFCVLAMILLLWLATIAIILLSLEAQQREMLGDWDYSNQTKSQEKVEPILSMYNLIEAKANIPRQHWIDFQDNYGCCGWSKVVINGTDATGLCCYQLNTGCLAPVTACRVTYLERGHLQNTVVVIFLFIGAVAMAINFAALIQLRCFSASSLANVVAWEFIKGDSEDISDKNEDKIDVAAVESKPSTESNTTNSAESPEQKNSE